MMESNKESNRVFLEMRRLENFLGMPIRRVELTPRSREPYDETFANLSHRFYGREDRIDEAILLTTRVLVDATTSQKNSSLGRREISLLFSILGTLYYLQEHYDRSIGCFMKALSWYRDDMVPWIELMFAIRAASDYHTFEGIIMNLDRIYGQWRIDPAKDLTKELLLTMIRQ